MILVEFDIAIHVIHVIAMHIGAAEVKSTSVIILMRNQALISK